MRGLQEVVPIQDTLCSGIGAIEKLEGDLFRFWMYVTQASEDSGTREKVLVAKIVISKAAIPDAILQTIAAITDCETIAAPIVPEMCH
jgi:hypothetical protein